MYGSRNARGKENQTEEKTARINVNNTTIYYALYKNPMTNLENVSFEILNF